MVADTDKNKKHEPYNRYSSIEKYSTEIAEYFSLEVYQGKSLYIFIEELMRWRGLLEVQYQQYRLGKRRRNSIYSQ